MDWVRCVSPGGSILFFRIEDDCLENVVHGRLDTPTALQLQRELDQIEERHGTFAAFSYWGFATEYDSDFQARWLQWLATKRDGVLTEAHFMTRSSWVRSGIAVVNVAYPPIRFGLHADDASYLVARQRRMTSLPFPSL